MTTKMSQLEAGLSNVAEWEESTNIPSQPHLIVLLPIIASPCHHENCWAGLTLHGGSRDTVNTRGRRDEGVATKGETGVFELPVSCVGSLDQVGK
jgi:hypothetical protein